MILVQGPGPGRPAPGGLVAIGEGKTPPDHVGGDLGDGTAGGVGAGPQHHQRIGDGDTDLDGDHPGGLVHLRPPFGERRADQLGRARGEATAIVQGQHQGRVRVQQHGVQLIAGQFLGLLPVQAEHAEPGRTRAHRDREDRRYPVGQRDRRELRPAGPGSGGPQIGAQHRPLAGAGLDGRPFTQGGLEVGQLVTARTGGEHRLVGPVVRGQQQGGFRSECVRAGHDRVPDRHRGSFVAGQRGDRQPHAHGPWRHGGVLSAPGDGGDRFPRRHVAPVSAVQAICSRFTLDHGRVAQANCCWPRTDSSWSFS